MAPLRLNGARSASYLVASVCRSGRGPEGVGGVSFDERVSEELTTKQVGRMDGRSGGRVGP